MVQLLFACHLTSSRKYFLRVFFSLADQFLIEKFSFVTLGHLRVMKGLFFFNCHFQVWIHFFIHLEEQKGFPNAYQTSPLSAEDWPRP